MLFATLLHFPLIINMIIQGLFISNQVALSLCNSKKHPRIPRRHISKSGKFDITNENFILLLRLCVGLIPEYQGNFHVLLRNITYESTL